MFDIIRINKYAINIQMEELSVMEQYIKVSPYGYNVFRMSIYKIFCYNKKLIIGVLDGAI